MPALRTDIDPDGLLEYSVVFTDRSLNHMSTAFQTVMHDIHETLCGVYHADRAVIVPGGGSYAMEAVARQFATDASVLVIRNGLFSYRWSQIFAKGSIPRDETVLRAVRVGDDGQAPFGPCPIEDAVARIAAAKPDVVFAPHVETASGILLPDDYIRALADAVHRHGGLLVLDCVASGCIWVDMEALGVDVLISAPQKGWSAPPSAGLVMLRETAIERCRANQSTSFAVDLGRWLEITEAYLAGGFAYHATMPTDALRTLRDAMAEARRVGLDRLQAAQWELGTDVRRMLAARGFPSVAAAGFEAPGVIVSYTRDPDIQNGRKFVHAGFQVAAGVPLMVDEGPDFRTFRIGLFGLDKLTDVAGTRDRLAAALAQLG
ncbi:aminotransferase class V-fold PLP-dependent enzyme [Altererythrobacter sp. TH136]|uniref:aminotransferase class V-fold PLP-dependent enzyme n=1 Tax=Altererythrobacter sp. TH136 TaxID=2067415 RepID=UPI001162C23D|nr:aminotransferase class V-fold PLP-dependent enzyme [Altererythrobacter sp. TH136]QDM40756.1 alanine--glyoxylate aminotransferase family protein [Altererythrobacter sp. TH136]